MSRGDTGSLGPHFPFTMNWTSSRAVLGVSGCDTNPLYHMDKFMLFLKNMINQNGQPMGVAVLKIDEQGHPDLYLRLHDGYQAAQNFIQSPIVCYTDLADPHAITSWCQAVVIDIKPDHLREVANWHETFLSGLKVALRGWLFENKDTIILDPTVLGDHYTTQYIESLGGFTVFVEQHLELYFKGAILHFSKDYHDVFVLQKDIQNLVAQLQQPDLVFVRLLIAAIVENYCTANAGDGRKKKVDPVVLKERAWRYLILELLAMTRLFKYMSTTFPSEKEWSFLYLGHITNVLEATIRMHKGLLQAPSLVEPQLDRERVGKICTVLDKVLNPYVYIIDTPPQLTQDQLAAYQALKSQLADLCRKRNTFFAITTSGTLSFPLCIGLPESSNAQKAEEQVVLPTVHHIVEFFEATDRALQKFAETKAQQTVAPDLQVLKLRVADGLLRLGGLLEEHDLKKKNKKNGRKGSKDDRSSLHEMLMSLIASVLTGSPPVSGSSSDDEDDDENAAAVVGANTANTNKAKAAASRIPVPVGRGAIFHSSPPATRHEKYVLGISPPGPGLSSATPK